MCSTILPGERKNLTEQLRGDATAPVTMAHVEHSKLAHGRLEFRTVDGDTDEAAALESSDRRAA